MKLEYQTYGYYKCGLMGGVLENYKYFSRHCSIDDLPYICERSGEYLSFEKIHFTQMFDWQ